MNILTQVHENLCKTTTLKNTKNGFQDRLLLNAGQKYCREYLAILSTSINLSAVIASILECPFYAGFTVGIRNAFSIERKSLSFV